MCSEDLKEKISRKLCLLGDYSLVAQVVSLVSKWLAVCQVSSLPGLTSRLPRVAMCSSRQVWQLLVSLT